MRTTLSILLVLIATTASAQPKLEDSNHRVNIAGHKPKLRPDTPTGWTELASPTPVRHGTEFILVGKARSFSQLRIDAVGTVILLRVQLSFADGTVKTVRPGRTLDARRPSMIVDVPAGRPITQIAVSTARYTKGAYSVHALSEGRTVAER